ncbi:MAG TPA: hypothetical protein VF746_11370 [Longimicrobium sp.]|jgi:hypothetical protein
MPTRSRAAKWLAVPTLVLLGACVDRNPLAPEAPIDASAALVECRVSVAQASMSCAPLAPPSTSSGARADRVVGGQEVYVKLASAGTGWDPESEILRSSVTLQNLLRQSMGTVDGTTVAGVKVFFHTGPTVTAGTGTVTVANPDGTGTFLGGTQEFFLYGEILSPYQVSSAKLWQFHVPSTVQSFVFTVYVSAPLVDESGTLLDRVWNGGVDGDWQNAANWQGGVAPDSQAVVAIPGSTLVAGPNQPGLSADARVLHLRVGAGSTLGLNSFTLEARGNVDAVGAVGGGTLKMSGADALLGGSVAALEVAGSTSLQGATKAAGAVTVTGSLTTNGNALTISIP